MITPESENIKFVSDTFSHYGDVLREVNEKGEVFGCPLVVLETFTGGEGILREVKHIKVLDLGLNLGRYHRVTHYGLMGPSTRDLAPDKLVRRVKRIDGSKVLAVLGCINRHLISH